MKKILITIILLLLSVVAIAQTDVLAKNQLWVAKELRVISNNDDKDDTKATVNCLIVYNSESKHIVFSFKQETFIGKIDKSATMSVDNIKDSEGISCTMPSQIIQVSDMSYSAGYINFLFKGNIIIAVTIIFSTESYHSFTKMLIFVL